jgi:hypothetical protein
LAIYFEELIPQKKVNSEFTQVILEPQMTL